MSGMCSLSKADVAPLTALLTVIKNSFDAHPEMYRILLAILCDYDPTKGANREKTCRYIRILLKDKVLANCVITSLPQVPEKVTPVHTVQSTGYPLKKRIKHRYCFNPKKTSSQLLHTRLLRSSRQIAAHSRAISNQETSSSGSQDSKTSDVSQNDKTRVDDGTEVTAASSHSVNTVATTAPPAEVCSAADGLLALTSGYQRKAVVSPEIPVQSVPSTVQTEAISSHINPSSTKHVLPWQPHSNVGQGLYTIQGQGQHTSCLPSTPVGLSYPYYPYGYGQPFPSLPGCVQGYGPIPYLPWGSLQPVTGMPLYGATAYSNLLDLSTTSKHRSGPSRPGGSSVGVARPLKRSETGSGDQNPGRHTEARKTFPEVTKVTTSGNAENTQEPVLATTETHSKQAEFKSVQKENVDKKPSVSSSLTEQRSSSILALEQLTSNVEKSFQSSIQSQEPSLQASQSKANAVKVQVFQSEPEGVYRPTDDISLSRDSNVMLGKTAQSFETVSWDANLRSFPYRQRIQLPDGTCPLVHFPGDSTVSRKQPEKRPSERKPSVLFTWRDAIKPTCTLTGVPYSTCSGQNLGEKAVADSIENKERNKETESQPVSCSSGFGNSSTEFTQPTATSAVSLIAKEASVKHLKQCIDTKRPESVPLKHQDSKTRKVKIKLDKQSGGQFLAELMKLNSAYSISNTAGVAATSVTAYRTPLVPHGMNLLRGRAVTARQLLLTNRGGWEEPQRKRFCSVPAIHHSSELDNTTVNVEESSRSKSQSDVYQQGFTNVDYNTVNQVEFPKINNNKDQPNHQWIEQSRKGPVDSRKLLISDKVLLQAIRDRIVSAGSPAAGTHCISSAMAGVRELETSNYIPLPKDVNVQTCQVVNRRTPLSEQSLSKVENSAQCDITMDMQSEASHEAGTDISENLREHAIPESGSSSLSLSPYLLGLLPVDEEGADDVFMEDSPPPDKESVRSRFYSAPASSNNHS